MRRKALDSALLGKVLDQEILVIERFDIDRPSTKRMVAILRNIGLNKSCLLGMSDYDTNLILSARNIPYLRLMHVKDFNAYDVLRHQRILLTRDSLSYLIARRGGMLEEPSIAST
jgi:large subunit ribosomal protein L4